MQSVCDPGQGQRPPPFHGLNRSETGTSVPTARRSPISAVHRVQSISPAVNRFRSSAAPSLPVSILALHAMLIISSWGRAVRGVPAPLSSQFTGTASGLALHLAD